VLERSLGAADAGTTLALIPLFYAFFSCYDEDDELE
jgi:hypothetical protein